MENDFIVTAKDSTSVQISIRVEKKVKEGFDQLAKESGRTRNELINQALKYSLKNVKLMLEE